MEMAHNTRDINGRWLEDRSGRVLSKAMEFIQTSEQLYQESLDIWALHGNDDALVAAQLYPDDDPALALAKTLEQRAALTELHNVYTTIDWSALRRVANYTSARMG